MCGNEENDRFAHRIYKNDPLTFRDYVGKTVRVLSKDAKENRGVVYTVDPVSESVVLLQGPKNNDLKIIFGHVIEKIEVLSEDRTELPELFRNSSGKCLQADLDGRKTTTNKILMEN